MDVVAWLRVLGLEQYAPAFRDNDVDAEVLPALTSDDLISIGVTSVGHRRKLLAAIASLDAAPPAATVTEAPRDAPTPADAERRQLTVMFCDLVGSTELSARLDPEDLREVIAAYHLAVTDIVRSFDGFVAKYMGDGVLVYLGYPRAHEDDAERAVRAGLGVIDAIGRLDLRSVKLQARVGIATGLVVVGDLIGEGSAQEQAVVGETPNLAARLQALAGPDEIVIPEDTRRLVANLFEYESLGEVKVRGLQAPVRAFRVLRESQVGSRFEALRTGETPLIGREEEIELLSRRWAQAKAGLGRVVLISAEPGMGKSRLAEAFRQSLEREPHFRLRHFCSPHHQDSALFPFIAQLGRAAGFERDDTPLARLEKLEALITANGPPEGDVPLLAELLSVPFDSRYPALDLTPRRKKEKTFEAFLRQLAGLAGQQPLLMIFEDLHWADPTSRELLDLTVEQIEGLPVLLIATFRPEFQAPWTGQPHVTALALRRLGREESGALVHELLGASVLSAGIVDEIVERTDGVPLFLEELTKAVVEARASGADDGSSTAAAAPAPTLAVPATLHASLMSRLDRLGRAAKEIAQVGAVIGREFSYELLAAAAQRPEKDLRDGLRGLVHAGLVFQRGAPPEATFSFKHALVRDAAHGTLLRGSRQQLHARIAEALEAQSPELMDSQPELFAQHYAEAGLVEKSVTFWGKAGQRSATRSAMAEAAAQFQKGLDQLALLSETPERQRQGLELRSALGVAVFALKGPGAPETGLAYASALELWTRLGSPAEFLGVPYGRLRYLLFRGELDVALDLEENLLRLSRERYDVAGLIQGHSSIGRTLMFAGKFGSSRSHLEEMFTLYNTLGDHSPVGGAPVVIGVGSRAYLGIVLFCLGYLDQGLSQSNAAVANAISLAHPTSLGVGLARARLLSLAGDDAALSDFADQLISVATEQGFLQWHAQGTIYRGWVKARAGRWRRGCHSCAAA
jgi:class 3 adenylate cyclase/tetratricopeptide (TPR) repeat protein